MLKKTLTSIMIIGFMCNVSFSADEFALMHEERIGSLRIGLSEGNVKKAIHCTLKRGPENFEGADGEYHQEWVYDGCGITLDMSSNKKGGSKSINAITLVSPSILSTKRGIRIGSGEQDVIKAYKPYWSKDDSGPSNFVAGSVYGGLMFNFENGKVSRILLGAAAE